MFISRHAFASDADAHVVITMESITAGRREVAKFCTGTSLVAWSPKPNFAAGSRPIDDLSWWKPFLQLRGPDEPKRLFRDKVAQQAPAEEIFIDHSEDDVHVPYHERSSLFSSMRNRTSAPRYRDTMRDEAPDDAVPAAYVIAERVKAPVELRFFPQGRVRAARIVDC